MRQRSYMGISTAVLVLLWALLAVLVDNPVKMPTPWATFQALNRIILSESFLIEVGTTLRRAMTGFFIALTSALVLGILSGIFKGFYYLMRPIVLMQRAVPTMAVILLALIWMGRVAAPIMVCVVVIFPIIYSAVVNAIREVDGKLLEMAKVYKLTWGQRLRHLYLPSMASSLMAVAGAAISLNLKVTIAAEILGQPGPSMGMGFQLERVAVNTDGILAWSLVAIALGALLEYLVSPAFLGKFFRQLRQHG